MGAWSSTITSPIPALKPVSTGSEMKLATKPSRSRRAASSTRPVSTASVADAATSAAGAAFGAASASAAALRMPSVVVVLTLSTRELPSAA